MMDLFQEVRGIKDSYEGKSIEMMDGLYFSQHQTIRRVSFYTNSEYLSGKKDSLGNDKPFFNVVNGAVNVGVRATDFDTKNFQLIATDESYQVQSMLLRRELRQWMEDTSFDMTLNKNSETSARYGSSLVKKTKIKDNLFLDIVPWKNLRTDQVDIINNPIVEMHFMSQLDLAKKRSFWSGLEENYDAIMDLFAEQGVEQDKEDTITDRVDVYEIQGELSKAYLHEDAEQWELTLQKHFLIDGGSGKQFILHSEEIDEIDYALYSWEEVDGRALGRGMVEDGFESQTWINDSMISETEAMKLGSKVIFKSNDSRIYDNILRDTDNGDILDLEDGDITILNTFSNAMPQFSNQRERWKDQYRDTTSTFPGITGEQQPANTPLGSVQLQNAEARSIFDYKREKMGIFWEDLLERWVMPFLLTKIRKQHILNSEFSTSELEAIDDAFSDYVANQAAVDAVLDGKVFTAQDYIDQKRGILDKMALNKDRRFLNIPEGFFDDIETKVRLVTTNEKHNKQVILQSLTQLLQLIPSVKESPELMPIFARVIEMSGLGISPIEVLPAATPSPFVQPDSGGAPSENQTSAFAEALEEPVAS